MPCEQCKAGNVPCDLERDRVLLLDARARVVFIAPSMDPWKEAVGKRVDALLQPEDRDYVLSSARRVLREGVLTKWLIRDAWDERNWLAHVEPARGVDRDRSFAVATLRPVCRMVFELSRRQRQVLRELSRCCCTKKVAVTLGVHDTTIRSHLSRSQLAVHCAEVTELIRWAHDMHHALAIEDEIADYRTRRQG